MCSVQYGLISTSLTSLLVNNILFILIIFHRLEYLMSIKKHLVNIHIWSYGLSDYILNRFLKITDLWGENAICSHDPGKGEWSNSLFPYTVYKEKRNTVGLYLFINITIFSNSLHTKLIDYFSPFIFFTTYKTFCCIFPFTHCSSTCTVVSPKVYDGLHHQYNVMNSKIDHNLPRIYLCFLSELFFVFVLFFR